MSFITTIRDYIEVLNNISDSLGNQFTITTFISETLLYFLKTFQYALVYIVTFQWLRDFTLLPIVLPQVSASIFKENFFLETPSNVFFEFLEIPDLNQNKFLLGVFNSFFLSLPISVVHILSIRRLLIQGIPAGCYSIAGYLFGQVLFLTFTIFGIRAIIIPWLTLEPLNYILGVILIFRILYSMRREHLKELKGWVGTQYNNYFLTSLLLAWCEQTSIYQYFGNLTLSSNVTILESFSSNSSIGTFFTHFLYIIGISLGAFIFTSAWGLLFLQIKKSQTFSMPRFIRVVNRTTFVSALAFSLSSLPFYGVDYLLTNPLGFVSQDTIFKNTLLDQYNLKDTVGIMSTGATKNIHVDVSPFDRSRYLLARDAVQPLSFEDLNYRGEFEWVARHDKVSTITQSRAGKFNLSRFIKKPKRYQSSKPETMFLEKEQENKLIKGYEEEIVDENTDITNRFFEWYDSYSEINPKSETAKIIPPYSELYKVSFPSDYLRTISFVEPTVEQKIKGKYYSNSVYKTLLAFDIDLFLKRQPKHFQLDEEQETDLYTKREMLESYFDSLRDYSQLPYVEKFEDFFDGTKSFSNKVYNQQFKGTLRSVRRLFSLKVDENTEEPVLKFDQPLYTFLQTQNFSPLHEELNNESKNVSENFSIKNEFIPNPLYAGWDENLRKFVITNKYLPRNLANYKVNINTDIRSKFQTGLSKKKAQKIKFTAWPLSFDKLSIGKRESEIPYVTLFELKSTNPDTQGLFVHPLESLPANLESYKRKQKSKVVLKDKESFEDVQFKKNPFDFLAPKRGGFIWSGNSKIKFNSNFQFNVFENN